MSVIRKSHASTETKGLEFVLSDATPDRYGDVIEAAGWVLDEFKSNPIALYNHNPDFVIGKWKQPRIVKGQLRAHLELAPEGTSARIDEIRKLIDADILRTVSVGFLPDEYEPLGQGRGSRYLKQRLMECSVVAIPANPNALAVSKALGISSETVALVFGEQAKKDFTLLTREAPPASTPKSKDLSFPQGKPKMSYAQRITQLQARCVELTDQLGEFAEAGSDDAIEAATTELETVKKTLATLTKAEAALGNNIVPIPIKPVKKEAPLEGEVLSPPARSDVVLPIRRLFAAPGKNDTGMDLLVRAIAMDLRHFAENRKRPLDAIIKGEFGDGEMYQKLGTIMSRFGISKAATIPADTVTSGWAAQLAQTVIGDFIESLLPYSIYPQLRSRGGSFTFGRNGTLSLPARNVATSIAGAFVAQGAAIPVKQGAFTAITLTPKKMGVITTMTREITEHSTPQIETILRQAIMEDTGVAIDAVLLDNIAATTIRPEGLRFSTAKVNASATASIVGFIADLKALYAALITATSGNVRNPVWIMNPGDVLAASLLQTTTGDTPFRQEMAGGTLLGIPVIQSTTGLSDIMAIMDAADFLTATGDTPQFSVSDQAVLHMEDSNPAALSTVGTPNAVAAPMRSLWQTDTMAIRMILDINWAKRRAGIFQWTDTMAWN